MRITLALLFISVVASAPAFAQQPASNNRLRSLLEKNFNKPKPAAKEHLAHLTRPAPKSQPASPADGTAARNPKELLIIRPGGKIERVPVKKAPDRRSQLDPAKPNSNVREVADGDTLSEVWNYVRSLWQPKAPANGEPLTLTATATGNSKAKASVAQIDCSGGAYCPS